MIKDVSKVKGRQPGQGTRCGELVLVLIVGGIPYVGLFTGRGNGVNLDCVYAGHRCFGAVIQLVVGGRLKGDAQWGCRHGVTLPSPLSNGEL